MASRTTTSRLRREFLVALDEVEAAQIALREQLTVYRSLVRRSRRHLERGGAAAGLFDLIEMTEVRSANDDSLRALEAARTRSQYALYRLVAAEGMTAAEIGRRLGVSRQLVSRILNRRDDQR